MIDEMLDLLLTHYNKDYKAENAVTAHDTFFKSYLIGYLTWNLTNEQIKENIGYLKGKN